MIDAVARDRILAGARVLEQIPDYVTAVTDLEGMLFEGHVIYREGARLVLVGYPLEGEFDTARFEALVDAAVRAFAPEAISAIAPELGARFGDREAPDDYYRVELATHRPRPKVSNMVRRAARELEVGVGARWKREHRRLVRGFLHAHAMPPAGASIYERVGTYLAGGSARLLEARDARGRLVACDVVETGARGYDFHAFSFRSPGRAPPGASDLLFARLLEDARGRGKAWLGMGLGSSPGVVFFKRKWGGRPYARHLGGHAVLGVS